MNGMPTGFAGSHRKYDTGVFERHELSNGIIVWRSRPPILLTEEGLMMAFYPGVGSCRDPLGREGLAHFFEHLPFRGTKNYPSKELIYKATRDEGGHFNATTSSFWTSYYVSLPVDKYGEAVRLVRDLASEPILRSEDVDIERGAILSEYERKFANGERLAQLDVVRELLGPNHPLAHSPVGDPESLAVITLADIKKFQSDFYHSGNLHLVVGGSFAEREDWREVLEAEFGNLPGHTCSAQSLPDLPFYKTGKIKFTDPKYRRDSLSYHWLLPAPADPERAEASAELMVSALSGGGDSPLMLELRERLGLVYESGLADIESTPCGWWFSLYLPVPSSRFKDAEDAWRKTLDGFSEKDILRCQTRRQRDRRTAFNDPVDSCFSVRDEIISYGRPISFREAEDLSDTLTLPEVLFWRDYLKNSKPMIAEIETSNN